MSPSAGVEEYTVRPYRDEDEPQVLALLGHALGGGPSGHRSSEFFRWKHVDNPFGPSLMLVADLADRVIGLRAFMRWRFRADDRVVEAVRAVDTATHPEYQGLGVFRRLTEEALGVLEREVDLIFNTPNEKSLPGYLKMGWETVGRIPVHVRVRRPVRFVRRVRSLGDADASGDPLPVDAPTAADVLGARREVEELLAGSSPIGDRLTTPLTHAFLWWRYGSAPELDYRIVSEERGSELAGFAVFRVRPRGSLRETTIADVVVRSGDKATATRLLRRAIRAAPVDHVTCHFARGSEADAVARRCGFVPVPAGVTFVVNPLRSAMRPDPRQLRSWRLSLGDVEVF
jgi:GNAT superfamily N-acetyltransferase